MHTPARARASLVQRGNEKSVPSPQTGGVTIREAIRRERNEDKNIGILWRLERGR